MGKLTNIKDKLKEVYNTPFVQKTIANYNTFCNTKSNPFSNSANELITNNSFVPEFVQKNYSSLRNAFMTATSGMIGSNILTYSLRYQKPINKVIDFGVEAARKTSQAINSKIDDVVEKNRMRKAQRGYEFPALDAAIAEEKASKSLSNVDFCYC